MWPGCSACYAAAGLVLASLAVAFFSTAEKKAFRATLSPEQAQLYDGIVRRRAGIYAGSMLFGSAVAYAALVCMQKSGALSGPGAVCTSVAVMTGAAYAAYVLWPKGPFMLEYLTTTEQVRAWTGMYRRMARLFHGGFLMGVAAYALLAWSACGGGGGGGGSQNKRRPASAGSL
jgi:hypothetical protein